LNNKKTIIIFLHALIGWMLCAATIGIGMAVWPMNTALSVHAVAAPVFFTILSLVYFTRFNYTTPLQTASIFTGFVIVVDFFVVALLINKSMDMFTSLIGTWIPFALIFTATFLTGFLVRRGAGWMKTKE
jgi:phosphatidylserine synthase